MNDASLHEDDLRTLTKLCDLFEKTDPVPQVARQIETTRAVVSRLRASLHAPEAAQVTNVEIVRVEALARVAYFMVTDPAGQKYLGVMESEFGLNRGEVVALWRSVTNVMRAFEENGPYGYAGLN